MGFVDRGGGREAKGASLRRSKNNPGAATARNKRAGKSTHAAPAVRAVPVPPSTCVPVLRALVPVVTDAGAAPDATAMAADVNTAISVAQDAAAAHSNWSIHIDAAVALLSRKLEDDREGVARRAVEEGKLAAMICWCAEVERQGLLLETCVQHNMMCRGSGSGGGTWPHPSAVEPPRTSLTTRHVRFQGEEESSATPAGVARTVGTGVAFYAVLGVHVNSIDRVNMRLHDQWITELETNVKHGDVLGVLTGLNLSRDHGTHYAQERLFRECWRVAAEVHLPLLLHLHAATAATLTETVNRAAELLSELYAASKAAREEDEAVKSKKAQALPSAVVLYDGLSILHASVAMQQLLRQHRPLSAAVANTAAAVLPFYVLVTAEGLAEAKEESQSDDQESAGSSPSPSVASLAALLPSRAFPVASSGEAAMDDSVVHLSQLLIGTGAPWGTPQCLPDAHLRSLPNEPGNYPYVVQTVFNAMEAAPLPASAAAATTLLTVEALAAVAAVNNLRVFFHECVVALQPEQTSSSADDEDEVEAAATAEEELADEKEQQQQQQWAASKKPAAPTVVAGLADPDAKRDLEAVLAKAARELERVEQERLEEEAALAQARLDELHEKRSKRDKKKNVKANNRSNFTHFRNKDFAPRQHGQAAPMTAAAASVQPSHVDEDSETESGNDDHTDDVGVAAGSKTSASSPKQQQQQRFKTGGGRRAGAAAPCDSDGNVSGDRYSLAAEVERLLQAKAGPHHDPVDMAPVGRRQKKSKLVAEENNRDEDSEAEQAEADAEALSALTMQSAAQSSRRKRKKQQQRKQQKQGQRRGEEEEEDSDSAHSGN